MTTSATLFDAMDGVSDEGPVTIARPLRPTPGPL